MKINAAWSANSESKRWITDWKTVNGMFFFLFFITSSLQSNIIMWREFYYRWKQDLVCLPKLDPVCVSKVCTLFSRDAHVYVVYSVENNLLWHLGYLWDDKQDLLLAILVLILVFPDPGLLCWLGGLVGQGTNRYAHHPTNSQLAKCNHPKTIIENHEP